MGANDLHEKNILGCSTLTQMLIDKESEDIKGISFILSAKEEIFCPYRDIYRKALKILGYLQSEGLKPKDKLVLQLGDNYDFIHVFWACILGGIIPIPVVADEKDEYRRKLYNILLVVKDGNVIGSEDALEKLKKFVEKENLDINLLSNNYITSEKALSSAEVGQVYMSNPEDIAFIQFSSGSTGTPKGVVLTHKNLITNIDAIASGIKLTSEDVIVSWMPLTHDMGLIGCHLSATAMDISQYTMNTMLFVKRPTLWLEKISEHKATLLASPNFGLKYSLIGLERGRNKNYDFSSIRLILNGAEPISIKASDEFIDKMSKYGLKENVMFPVYGMAEASLAIAFPKLNEGRMNRIIVDRDSLTIGKKIRYLDVDNNVNASCYVDEGFAVKNCKIRICDNEDMVLSNDMLGIIHIKGGNVSEGYYCNNDANLETRTSDGWFRTGDIGFFCNDRIVVIGRSQEMVIVNGQNYFSNDLELIASKIGKIVINKVAVCSSIDRETQTEKIIVFVVHRGDIKKFVPLIHSLREHFVKSIGIKLDYIVPVSQIPKTSSGKLMRFLLKERFENGSFLNVIEQCNALIEEEKLSKNPEYYEGLNNYEQNSLYSVQDVEHKILSICHEVAPELNIGLFNNFFEYGINSLLLNQIAARLDEIFPNRITDEDFFKYSSVNKLSKYICGVEEEEKKYIKDGDFNKNYSNKSNSDIAIVGMAGILPGAANVNEFWSNLCGAVESVGSLPWNRKYDVENYLNSLGIKGNQQFKNSGFIYEIDKFDHEFFKVLKKEAIAMSPAQRLFLQTAYLSLEDAGYGGNSLRSSKTGVYVGYISDLDGYQYQEILKQSKDYQTPTGALSANISGRVSFFMDFQGPSIMVDSACSSSMSALNLACQAIHNGDCEQALVGGVELKVLPIESNEKVGIESSDGRTRPFSDNADGTGEGEGVVSILLKPLDKAITNKDNIYATIRSISSNQDGYSVGLSAPNPEAQTALIRKAIDKSNISADDISYIEAHGTGTQLGDPIEFNALTKAFRSQSDQKQFCAIGSVKSNIGHTYASSGLVSIVKSCLMLKHKAIPATLNINFPNSKIDFENSPFYLNRQYKEWDTETLPRRCGVSNFGFSGTNCHAILEEFVDSERPEQAINAYPFILSATTRNGLKTAVDTYFDYLSSNDEVRLSDICYTASVGRGHYQYRLAIVAKDKSELIEKLAKYEYATNLTEQRYVGAIKMIQDSRRGINWGELTIDDVKQLNESTNQCISELLNNKDDEVDRNLLIERLCNLYVRGSEAIWNDLFLKEDVRRISLPSYTFNSNRCWPEF